MINFKHKVKQHLWKLALDEVAGNDTDSSMYDDITKTSPNIFNLNARSDFHKLGLI